PAQPLRRAAPAWRSRTTPDAAGGSGDPRLLLLDQEILELLALGELRRQPARMLAAAGPGFRRIGRVAVLRRHLSPGGGFPGRLLGRLGGGPADRGTGTEQFLDGIALGRREIDDPLADRGDRLALLQDGLAALGLGDEGIELLGGKCGQI